MWKRSSSNPSPLRPERHVALITGASLGLGRAFAEQCARLGTDLILLSLPDSGLPRVARGIELLYDVQTDYVEMALTVPRNPQALARSISRHGTGVSVLINNAGVGCNSRLKDSTLRENESCILLNNLALRSQMKNTPVSISVLCPNGIRTNGECRQKIEAHGLIGELVSLDPGQVVACAMNGLFAGKAVIVPGFLNQCLAAPGRHVPRPIVCSVVSSFYGKTASGRTVTGNRARGGVATAPHPPPERRQCGQPVAYGGSRESIHRRLGPVCDL